MTDLELMQMALNCLTLFGEDIKSMTQEEHEAIVALRARLAQPEPEPVAWMFIKKDGMQVITDDPDYKDGTWTPLYTAPPQRQFIGLTDEEIMDACAAVWASHPIEVGQVVQDLLKERNT